jgi:hypothetical protein
VVTILSRDISDHHPCLVSMTTDIPKAKVFMFDNYWLLREAFMSVMQLGWNLAVVPDGRAKKLMAKFKNLRRVLRCWYAQISNLATTIKNNKMMLSFLDTIEEHMDLSLEEWNFRKMVQDNLNGLLEQQRIYWKQRGNIKWATFDDENTKFFHANATVRHSRNCIRSL